ncbi:histidine phosphatase family protein [Chitinivorax sp. PXF-14]|uniref:histidine phosphatase family protein n=1 Tax=Chitinivorax sp. PXF-14 TaxID=3230488 RepID=UPI003466482A
MSSACIYLLRHGETDWNRQGLAMGKTDIPLNHQGRRQAEQAARLLGDAGIARIYSSPLARTRETAEIMADILDCPIAFVDALKQCGWGEREGQRRDQAHWKQDWHAGRPSIGMEPYVRFAERVLGAWQWIARQPSPCLVVGHGAVLGVIEAHLGMAACDPLHGVPSRLIPPPAGGRPWQRQTLHGPLHEDDQAAERSTMT